MRACMDENGMKFDEGETDELTRWNKAGAFFQKNSSSQNICNILLSKLSRWTQKNSISNYGGK